MQVMYFSHFLVISICLSFCGSALGEPCGEDWLQYKSNCYRVVKADATFETAKFICTTLYKAGLLTTPTDSQEDIFVNLAKSIYGVTNGIWISGTQVEASSTACFSIGRNGFNKVTQDCKDRSSFVCEKRVPEKSDGQNQGAEDKMMSKELESFKSKMEKELTSLKETIDQILSSFQVPECKSDVNPLANSLVANNDVTEQNTTTSTALSLKCAAPPVIIKTPADGILEVKEGHNISLGCLPVGYPKPNIKWILPNGVHDSVSGQMFTITQSKSSQTGQYTCVADNKVGEKVKATFSVKVLHAPKLTVENNVIHTGTGQTVQLKCIVEAYPNAQIVWLKQKTEESLKQMEFKKLNETFIETTVNVTISDTASDLGVYTCSANNKEGSSRANVTLVGTAPFDVQVKNATELDINKFKLTLMATSYSGIQEYRLKIKVSENPFSMETTIQPTVVQVPGRKTYVEYFEMPTSYRKNYKVKLYAKNEFGWSESPEYEFNSTYVCGDTITATDSWRYLVSHEFYGKYKVPREFRCESHIGSDNGLQIQMLDNEYNNYHYNHQFGYVRINSVGREKDIVGNSEQKLEGSSFTFIGTSERMLSKGFKARLKSLDINVTTVPPSFNR